MLSVHENVEFYNNQSDGRQTAQTAQHLLRRLHHAPLLSAVHSVFWTPNGGATGDKKLSAWRTGGDVLEPPNAWHHKNVYFGVNPSAVLRQEWEASTNETIGAVNAFLAEFDGKDFVRDAEWQPLYVVPDLAQVAAATRTELHPLELTEERLAQRVAGRQRGALQRAQSTAIDAAYKANPAEYKARALIHIDNLPQRPTALWDSGGGYQGVWVFDVTVCLYNPDGTRNLAAYDRMTKLQRKWTAYVGGDPAASDLRRILRMPGSINFKPKYAPNYPTVEFVWCDLENEYNFDTLSALLPVDAPQRERRRVYVPSGAPVELGAMGDVPVLPRHFAIDALNHATDLRSLLIGYGYTTATGNRLSRPGGDTAGVELHADNTATIFSSADPLFCERRIRPADVIVMYDHGGDVEAFFLTLPEIRTLKEALVRQRAWMAAPVAIEALKEAGFKNPEQARKLLDTILQKCEQAKMLTVAPGYAYLSKHSTIALGGLSRYLARLFAAGFINLQMGKKGGEATSIELVLNSVLHNVNSSTLSTTGKAIHVVQNWIIYREYRGSEAFMNSHYAYSSTRTNATLPTLGANGLGALMALQLQDGTVSTKEAAAAVGYTYGAMARTLRRYVEHGLVDVAVGERNRKTYTLKDTWRNILQANLPKMPTYAVQLVRHVAALKSRESIKRFYGEFEKADKALAEFVRMDALLTKVKLAGGIVPFTRVTDKVNKHEERRRRLTHAYVIGERAVNRLPVAVTKPTAANQWRRREYAKIRPAAQHDWDAFNAWSVLEYGAGWWTKLDQTDVLGRYKMFEYARDREPTLHWVGLPTVQSTVQSSLLLEAA